GMYRSANIAGTWTYLRATRGPAATQTAPEPLSAPHSSADGRGKHTSPGSSRPGRVRWDWLCSSLPGIGHPRPAGVEQVDVAVARRQVQTRADDDEPGQVPHVPQPIVTPDRPRSDTTKLVSNQRACRYSSEGVCGMRSVEACG